MAGVLSKYILGELVSIGTLLAFTFVCLSILMLRKTRPNVDHHSRFPFLQWISIA
jgi:APA family basic amino acid/polyamine antiporter